MLAESGFNKKQQRQRKAHIENFSQKWRSKQRDAWTDLKSDFSSPLMLAPKRESKKKVKEDASTYDIGALLLQEETGSWRPAAFAAKKCKELKRGIRLQNKSALISYSRSGHGDIICMDALSLKWSPITLHCGGYCI
jgi:hypothetical protein